MPMMCRRPSNALQSRLTFRREPIKRAIAEASRLGKRSNGPLLAAAALAEKERAVISQQQERLQVRAEPCGLVRLWTCPQSRHSHVYTSGASARLRSPQLAAVPCGSRSMIATLCPDKVAAVAKWTNSVVFPAPPFWLMMARVFMSSPCQHVDMSE
jgi:hypothetical protein